MTFVFYQNILSIHQSAFIRNLAEDYPVILVVPEELDNSRARSGWNVPDFGKTRVVVKPTENELLQLLNQKDFIHVFSGIDSYTLANKAFKIAIKNRLKIGIISEPFNWLGWIGKMRFLKYLILRLRYNKRISFILAIGNRGRWCYEKTGFSKIKIFDWAYFSEKPDITIYKKDEGHLANIIFVGTLNENKNILSLISICKKIKEKFSKLQIIGDGTAKQIVLRTIDNDPNFEYLGILPHDEVLIRINEADLLVLPSIYKDGWGAVVNEALMCGIPVITSDNCGSSVLVNGIRGKVFSVEKNSLETVLLSFLQELPYEKELRIEIQKWANENISGESAASYFIHIIKYVFFNTNRPKAPWLENK
jgi:glycosyltransferase involved in cell wall biosynthesis